MLWFNRPVQTGSSTNPTSVPPPLDFSNLLDYVATGCRCATAPPTAPVTQSAAGAPTAPAGPPTPPLQHWVLDEFEISSTSSATTVDPVVPAAPTPVQGTVASPLPDPLISIAGGFGAMRFDGRSGTPRTGYVEVSGGCPRRVGGARAR